MRLFSYRDRPVHLGPYPLERLTRSSVAPALDRVPRTLPLAFDVSDPLSIAHAMAPLVMLLEPAMQHVGIHAVLQGQ